MKLRSIISKAKKMKLPAGKSKSATHGWIPNTSSPSMITPEEAVFLKKCATASSGKPGTIVDLGCWLGGTSIALAQGLAESDPDDAKPSERVCGYDLFVWESWMPAAVPYCLYESGDNFLPEARRLARDHGGGKIRLIKEDLTIYEWKGGAIKVLLVDAMKSEGLARQIARSFYPSLGPGALLIHQDYKHFHTSWIHLLQYNLRNHFRLDSIVPNSTTVSFEVVQPIPWGTVEQATEFAGFSDEEIDSAFRFSIDLIGKADYANVAAAHVMQYLHLGRKDRARETFDLYADRSLSEQGELAKVASLLGGRSAARS